MQAPSIPALDDPSLYLNRDLSWLEFNRRVLEEGCDPRVPLLERLKFLAIFTSNLDEFFMVRVGGIQQKVQAGLPHGTGADRMPPRLQLERIGQMVREMLAQQYHCFLRELLPALEKEGISLRRPVDLSEKEQLYLRDLYQRDLPGADAPGHRPRAPVPPPAQRLAQPGGAAAPARGRGHPLRRGPGPLGAAAFRAGADRTGPRVHSARGADSACTCPTCSGA